MTLQVKTVKSIRVDSLDQRYNTDSRNSITVLKAIIKLAGDPVERTISVVNPVTYTNYNKQGYEYNIMEMIESWLDGKKPLTGFTGFTDKDDEVYVCCDVLYGAQAGLTAIVNVISVDRYKLVE
jgi:hypothetical protein